MSGYLVFLCPRCGTPRYARENHKNVKCFRCDYVIQLRAHSIRIISRTKESVEAMEIVKRYKQKYGFKNRL